jgi:hypothetical protein
MSLRPSRFVGVVALCAGFFSSFAAHADDFRQQPTRAEYTAPLSQQTQPSYVPQSVALSGPNEITSYNEGSPVPPGYTPVERVRKGAVIGGAVTFGSLYLLSAFSASLSVDNGDGKLAPLYIPAVGPFVQMAQTDTATGNFFLAIDGAGQCLGLGLFIYGLASPKTILLRNDLAGGTAKNETKARVVPMTGQGTTGLAVVGTF